MSVVLDDRYEIAEQIGVGGAARVHRAVDSRLGRDVAVKLIDADAARTADPAGRDRFLREARTAARVHHPNLVAVFDAGESHGYLYLVMELIEGVSLAQRLAEDAPIDLATAADLTRQILAGLGAVHDAGIVHRDIKPANILIDAGGRVRLTDFGIARHLDDLGGHITAEGQVMGTPTYLAPEQAMGGEPCVATDLYLVGLVLDEMLTSRRSKVESPVGQAATLAAARAAAFDPRSVVSTIDPAVADIVVRATDPDPARRFRSAGDMAAALLAAIRGTSPVPGLTTAAIAPPATVAVPTAAGPTPVEVPATEAMAPPAAEPAPSPGTDVPTRPPDERPARAHDRFPILIGALVVLGVVAVVGVVASLPDDSGAESAAASVVDDTANGGGPVHDGETLDGRVVEIRPSSAVPFEGGVPEAIVRMTAATNEGCDAVMSHRDDWLRRVGDEDYGDAASVFAQHAQNIATFMRCDPEPIRLDG